MNQTQSTTHPGASTTGQSAIPSDDRILNHGKSIVAMAGGVGAAERDRTMKTLEKVYRLTSSEVQPFMLMAARTGGLANVCAALKRRAEQNIEDDLQ